MYIFAIKYHDKWKKQTNQKVARHVSEKPHMLRLYLWHPETPSFNVILMGPYRRSTIRPLLHLSRCEGAVTIETLQLQKESISLYKPVRAAGIEKLITCYCFNSKIIIIYDSRFRSRGYETKRNGNTVSGMVLLVISLFFYSISPPHFSRYLSAEGEI